MDSVRATWKNGQIILDRPTDWPEGCRLVIEPDPCDQAIGVREDEWSNAPQAIADWLKWYDALEPLVFSHEEEADIAAWRQRVKECTLASMQKNLEGLFE
jgi:hypothetical protein